MARNQETVTCPQNEWTQITNLVALTGAVRMWAKPAIQSVGTVYIDHA